MKYIAFIYTDEHNDGYNALVPDLEGCFSCGKTFEEAVEMIKEAAELYCEDLKTLPKTSTLEDLMRRDDLNLEPNAMPQLINVKVEKLKRLNIMMRSDIVDVLPERLVEFNGNRSAYLQNLVIQDLHSHHIAI